MNKILRALLLSTSLLAACSGGGSSDDPIAGDGGPITGNPSDCRLAPDPVVRRNELVAGEPAPNAAPLLRFVHKTDDHIMDDDGSAVNGASPLDPVHPVLEAAQRFQDEYSDEAMEAMTRSINGCHAAKPLALAIITGDNTDLGTVAELRRFIDNLDGDFDRLSVYEQNCTAGMPAELADQLCTRFTGRGTADTQTVDPDPDDPAYQFLPTRMARQLLDTQIAVFSGAGGNAPTFNRAPGLPQALRCKAGTAGCENHALAMPYYVAFGNHDGTARGAVATEPGLQELSLATGRHYLREQHEFIDEFFATTPQPGPVGHGFNHVEAARFSDADGRNDGYYAFDAGSGNRLRMIVLNTLVDGTDPRLPPEIRNPFALSDGTVDQAQFDWLKAELAAAQQRGQLVLLFSHHSDITFLEFGMFAALAPGGVAAAALDAELASYPNVVAWIAGHTHRHRIRAFKVENGTGGNGVINAPVTCKGPQPCTGFWQIETASLIDFPQEQRILEILDNGNGTGTIRSQVLQHDFEKAKALATRDDMCQFYLSDPATAQQTLTEADLSALCKQGGTRDGEPGDRNVDLMFKLP